MLNTDQLKVALRGNLRQKKLLNELYRIIKLEYSDAGKIFTPASPYGQLLQVLTSMNENWMFYLEDIANESNIATAIRQESIFGLAQLVGHNPTRSLAAQGVVSLSTKVLDEEIRGRYVNLTNNTPLKCKNNNLDYFLQFTSSTDVINLDILSDDKVEFRIIQGRLQSQTVVATGENIQSFNLTSTQSIDNDLVYVQVNGEIWSKAFSFYDMTNNSKEYLIKTNINGGIDVIFGNGNFGKVPKQGARIDISYVVSNGLAGNLEKSPSYIFEFQETTQTELDEEVDLNDIFQITMESSIDLGADPETSEFTKQIAPYASKSFVLINPNNYKNFLSRFTFLSVIEAWNTKNDTNFNDDNIVYLFLLPNISKIIDEVTDYYTIDIDKFKLSSDTKNAILEYIAKSGRQATTSELRILDGVIKRYVCNIYIRIFENSDVFQIKNQIQEQVATYFINNKRRDRLPKSDLIKIVEEVNGVDSVNITFISEENEIAIRNGFFLQETILTSGVTDTNRVNLTSGQNPKLGLDDFGDIELKDTDIVVLRGGFQDRNGNYYQEGLTNNNFGSLNIFITSKI